MNLNKNFLTNLSLSDVSFTLLGLVIIVATFFIGGISTTSLALVSPMILLLVYLRHKTDEEIIKLPKIVLVLILPFVFFSMISIFKSYDIHQSVFIFLWLIVSVIAGIEAGAMVKEEKGLAKFSNVIIFSSIIAVFSGLYLYFSFDDYSNLRFISTFFQPNPFAGFLLLPLSLLLPLFVYAENNKRKVFLGILSVLTLGSFILTVSRGAMVLFSFVWIFILIISLVKKEYKLKISQLLNIILIIILSIAFSVAVYKIKMSYAPIPANNNTATVNKNADLFSGGATKGEAVSSRLQYMKTSLLMTKDNLLHGVGIGAYREAEFKYRDNVIYQTNDPHNLYLRMFSEVGVLGGASFFVLITMLGLFILYKLWKTKLSDFSVIEIGLIAGTLGIILHNFMDVDWYFPANMLLSVIAFFVIFSVLSKNTDSYSVKNNGIIRIVFLVILFITSFFSIVIFLGNSSGMDGPYLARKDKNDEAVVAFQKGLSFDKYNPEVLSGYSSFLLAQSKNMSDIKQKKESLNEALNFVNTAILVKPHDSKLFSLRADIYKDLGNNDLSIADLENAIENNKTLDLTSYMILAQTYFEGKRYLDVVNLVDNALKYYPAEIFKDSFWASPDKGMLKFDIVILNSQKINALEKLDRKADIQKAKDLMKLY